MKPMAFEEKMCEEKMCEENDILVTWEKNPEGSRDKNMGQKVYKTMKGAGAANIAVGVIVLVVGIVAGILLIVTGGKLISDKSKILF